MPRFFRPVESNRLTQGFGENSVCAKKSPNGDLVRPFSVIDKVGTTCPLGYVDFYKRLGMRGHNGRDNAAWMGEPTYHGGLFTGWAQICRTLPNGKPDLDGGLNVVSHDTFPCSQTGCTAGTMHHILIRYAHGTPVLLGGAPVVPGTYIMKAGTTGSSSGVHVHWAPKWCDEKGTILHLDNGYEGAFDTASSLQDSFILDSLTPPKVPDLSSMDALRKFLFSLSLWLETFRKK